MDGARTRSTLFDLIGTMHHEGHSSREVSPAVARAAGGGDVPAEDWQVALDEIRSHVEAIRLTVERIERLVGGDPGAG